MSSPNSGSNATKRFAIHPEQELRPASRSAQTGKQRQKGRDADHRYTTNGINNLAVTIKFGAELCVDRPETISHIDAQPYGYKHGYEADDKHADRANPVGEEHFEVTQLVKPQHIGVEGRKKGRRLPG